MGKRLTKVDRKSEVWSRLHTSLKQGKLKLSPEEVDQEVDLEALESLEYSKVNLFLKRSMDILGSLALILVLSPILVSAAVIISVLTEDGIFYSEKRVGKNGEEFDFIKFKSMFNDAESVREKLGEGNEMTGPFFKMQNDPRVTEFGKFIRKYSVDELPQLFLVLKGDMSLVGPRPPQPKEFVQLSETHQKVKTKMRPGITCIWQVSGRNLISDAHQWMMLDYRYIKEWNIWFDIKLLLKTVPAALSGIGAS